MSGRPASARLKIERAGQASASFAYVEIAIERLLNISYGLSVLAEQAEIHLREEDSVLGTGLVAVTQTLINEIDDTLGEIQDMAENPEWNPGVRVAAA
jgi:hypothetical protein